MIMRYHWSLGIGHTYSHVSLPQSTTLDDNNGERATGGNENTREGESGRDDAQAGNTEEDPVEPHDFDDPDSDDPELAMDERENEDLGPEDWDRDDAGLGAESDDEVFEMYFM